MALGGLSCLDKWRRGVAPVAFAEWQDIQSSLSASHHTNSYQATKCVVKDGQTRTQKGKKTLSYPNWTWTDNLCYFQLSFHST